MVGGSTRIPKVQQIMEAWIGDKSKIDKSLNPDESIATGACYLAASIKKLSDKTTLIDVIPMSRGIEMQAKAFSQIIPFNTQIPCSFKKNYTNCMDNQTSIDFPIYEGKGDKTIGMAKLGQFSFKGIPPMPAGEADIEVEFKIDEDGIMHVTAFEVSTGKKHTMSVENKGSGRLTEEEKKKLLGQMQSFGDELKVKKERANAKNELETFVYKLHSQPPVVTAAMSPD